MAKMVMPKKEAEEPLPEQTGQKRAALARYRLQVDRQTKDSFSSKAEAEKAGAAIKKAHPQVQVSVYDAEDSETTIMLAARNA